MKYAPIMILAILVAAASLVLGAGQSLAAGFIAATPASGQIPASGVPPGAFPYDIGFSIPGVPVASQITPFVCPRLLTFPAYLAGTQVSCGTNPSESDTYTVKVAGSAVGTIALSTSCVATLTAAAPFTCTAGQRLELDAPATVSGADIAITLSGVRWNL